MVKSKALLFLALAAIIISGCTSGYSGQKPAKEAAEVAQKAELRTVSTGSTQTGDVLIELTPKYIGSNKLAVDFSANTHSVDLTPFDLMMITALEHNGNVLKPESAPSLSGHHGSGTLVFDTGKELKTFKITIKGIPAVEERVFEWG